jgi:hypothetical protein
MAEERQPARIRKDYVDGQKSQPQQIKRRTINCVHNEAGVFTLTSIWELDQYFQ